MSKPLSKKQRQLQDDMVLFAINTVKFTALLVLRNQGWGATRLTRFSDKMDELLTDINSERLTFSDIMLTLEEETGLSHKEFLLKTK